MMGLIIEPLLKTGDKVIAGSNTRGIGADEFPITITQRSHDRTWYADGKTVTGYLVNEVWIENGDLVKTKEEDMGLMLPEEAPTAANKEAAPPKLPGQGTLDAMQDAYKAANSAGKDSRILIDGLNNLYRSKAYRDWVRQSMSEGTIHPSVVKDMEALLYRWRYATRHPHAKAWRRQWP